MMTDTVRPIKVQRAHCQIVMRHKGTLVRPSTVYLPRIPTMTVTCIQYLVGPAQLKSEFRI